MTLKPGNIDGLINAAGSQGEPLDGRPKQHQGLCPCKPALAAEGSGARGGEATPHTRADAEPTPKGAGPPPFNLTELRSRHVFQVLAYELGDLCVGIDPDFRSFWTRS